MIEQSPFAEKPLVILNPAANRGNMQYYRHLVQQRIHEQEADYCETSYPAEATHLARQAAQAGCPLIVVGGDGSLHEVINGLLSVEKRVPLGIIAAGSGNDFAWNTLKLPRDPHQLVECAFNGRVVDVDAGCVNGQYFANGFSVGLDADIGELTNRMKSWPLLRGAGLYYAAAVRQILFRYRRCPWLSFHLDDATVAAKHQGEQRYVLLAVSNGPAYGAGFRINPSALYDDGLFDICVVDYTPVWRVMQLLPSVKKGLHGSAHEVSFYRSNHVVIESRVPVMLQADGETMSVTRVDARVLPGALRVRVSS